MFAGYDEKTGKIYVLAYNFNPDINSKSGQNIVINLKNIPNFEKYKVTTYLVSDENNYFPVWQQEAKKIGIKDEDYGWSKDDFVIPNNTTLKKGAHIDYFSGREPFYKEHAQLRPTSQIVGKDDLSLRLYLPHHGVVLFEIEPVK